MEYDIYPVSVTADWASTIVDQNITWCNDTEPYLPEYLPLEITVGCVFVLSAILR